MKKCILFASIFAVLLLMGPAFADEPAKTPDPAPVKAAATPCPVCVMMEAKELKMDVLKDAGVTPAMVQQCKMMMGAEMSRDDALCLLVMKDKLKLTKEQVEKLQAGLGAARQAVAELLTTKQRDEMWTDMSSQQLTICDIHGRIHEMLRQKIEEPGVSAPCPFCAVMGGNGIDLEKAKAAGLSSEMLAQAEILLGTGFTREDAQCLLVLKDEFKLSPEQVEKLGQSIADSRKAACAVLTPEQQKVLSELPEKAVSVKAIHGKVHGTEATAAPVKEEKPKADEAAKPKEAEKPKEAAAAKPEEKK